MPGLAMHRSNDPPASTASTPTASSSNATSAPAARASAANSSEAALRAPAATASASTRPSRSGSRYATAARPLLPRPKTSTRPRWCGACLRFAMSSREAMDYATAMRVSAKYSEKPVAASTPEMIQKRTTTFVSLQPFFSKWWCNGAMRKMRFFVFL